MPSASLSCGILMPSASLQPPTRNKILKPYSSCAVIFILYLFVQGFHIDVIRFHQVILQIVSFFRGKLPVASVIINARKLLGYLSGASAFYLVSLMYMYNFTVLKQSNIW